MNCLSGVQGAVAMLNSKLSLMDPAILDVVEPRLQGIMHKLTQITDKQSINNEAEKQSKVFCNHDLFAVSWQHQTTPDCEVFAFTG